MWFHKVCESSVPGTRYSWRMKQPELIQASSARVHSLNSQPDPAASDTTCPPFLFCHPPQSQIIISHDRVHHPTSHLLSMGCSWDFLAILLGFTTSFLVLKASPDKAGQTWTSGAEEEQKYCIWRICPWHAAVCKKCQRLAFLNPQPWERRAFLMQKWWTSFSPSHRANQQTL